MMWYQSDFAVVFSAVGLCCRCHRCCCGGHRKYGGNLPVPKKTYCKASGCGLSTTNGVQLVDTLNAGGDP